MKLKKELRAVKEINEQVRREREEQEKMKQTSDKDKNKDAGGGGGNSVTSNSSPSHGTTTPNNVANSASGLGATGGLGDTKMAT